MKSELTEQIIDKIRREHNITIKKDDPLFAMVTANELIMEEHLKQLIKTFEDQRIETEIATENYLNKAKTILEEKLTYVLKEVKTEIQTTTKEDQTKTKNIDAYLKHPLLLTTMGIIMGYSIALFVL